MTAVAAQPVAARAGALPWLAFAGVGLAALTAAGPALHHRLGGWAFFAFFAIGGAVAYAATRLAERADQRAALLIILGAAVAMRLAMLFAEPYLSSDLYRYIWDGRVQAAGINPYRYVPGAPELAHLRDSGIFPNINRANYAVTIYPPVAQAIFLAVTRVSESVVAWKLALLLLEGVTVAAIIALLKRQGAPATRIAAYAWHPLPVWEIAGNGHVDAAMVALLLLGLLLFLEGRTLVAGVTVTVGALVKPTALLALPVFWRPWDWRLPLAVAATIAVAYLPYLSVGSGVIGFVPGYIAEEGLVTGAGFKLVFLIEQLTGPLSLAAAVYLALSALALVGLALAIGYRTDRSEQASIRSLAWLLIAFLVLSSPHYPWYFLVLVPFLALAPSASAWMLTLGGALFYNVIDHDVLPSYEARITVFTLAMLAALAHDLWGLRRAPVAVTTGERP
jgi:hypothetical protein